MKSLHIWGRLLAMTLCCVLLAGLTAGCSTDDLLAFLPGHEKEVAIPIVPETTAPEYDGGDAELDWGDAELDWEDATTAPTTATTTTQYPTTTLEEGKVMYVVAGGGLRMRAEPNTDAEIILTIPTKTKIRVLREEGEWSYVRYKGKEGWCANAWIFRSIGEATTTAKTKK